MGRERMILTSSAATAVDGLRIEGRCGRLGGSDGASGSDSSRSSGSGHDGESDGLGEEHGDSCWVDWEVGGRLEVERVGVG